MNLGLVKRADWEAQIERSNHRRLRWLRLHPLDQVGTAVAPLASGRHRVAALRIASGMLTAVAGIGRRFGTFEATLPEVISLVRVRRGFSLAGSVGTNHRVGLCGLTHSLCCPDEEPRRLRLCASSIGGSHPG